MTESTPIRLGTRASVLARTQSTTVGEALAAAAKRPWLEVLVRTSGDDTSQPLDQPGSPGLFVSTLRRALLTGEADVIVHSYKDLPSAPEPGITLAAVPGRVDPRDALVSRDRVSLADLPVGARVGTSSPRRAAALRRLRPDLDIVPFRGNVDSRIRKVRDGEVEATVMAMAGLSRIGRLDEVTEVLQGLLPAPAQGALAVECREDDAQMRAWLSPLDDPLSRLVTTAERFVLVGINAACTTPIGAFAAYESGQLRLRAELTADGRLMTADVTAECEITDLPAARTLGMRAAAQLSGRSRPVLLVRSEGNESDATSLADFGLASISEPYVRISPVDESPEGRTLIDVLLSSARDPELASRTWLVATSPMTVPSWLLATEGGELPAAAATAAAAGVRAAATGLRTAATLRELGFDEVVTPQDASARGLVSEFERISPGRVLFPHGNLALRILPEGLRSLGWDIEEAVVYRTDIVTDTPASVPLVEASEVAAVILRSPSAVRALVAHAKVPDDVMVVCAGRTTAEAAAEAGLTIAAVASSPNSEDVARAVADLISATSREDDTP